MLNKISFLTVISVLLISCANEEFEYSYVKQESEEVPGTGDFVSVFYKDGDRISGTIIDRWENGNLKYKMNVRNGVLNGLYREYYRNGVVQTETKYRNGLRHGSHRIYNYNSDNEIGTIFGEHSFKDDLLHGTSKIYWSEDQVRVKSDYKYGEKHGLHEEWDRDGNLLKRVYYENGVEANR